MDKRGLLDLGDRRGDSTSVLLMMLTRAMFCLGERDGRGVDEPEEDEEEVPYPAGLRLGVEAVMLASGSPC